MDGAEQLHALAQRLKAEGQGELLKDLKKALQLGAKPLTPKTRQVARDQLPHRGGLNERVARASQRVTARTGGTQSSVRITLAGSKKGSGAVGADRGVVRHPVFGRGPFVSQQVRPGWFSHTLEQEAPAVVDDLLKVMKDVALRLTRG